MRSLTLAVVTAGLLLGRVWLLAVGLLGVGLLLGRVARGLAVGGLSVGGLAIGGLLGVLGRRGCVVALVLLHCVGCVWMGMVRWECAGAEVMG